MGWCPQQSSTKTYERNETRRSSNFYHTGTERQAVGIMQVTSEPYPNPEEDNKRFIVVDVKYKNL